MAFCNAAGADGVAADRAQPGARAVGADVLDVIEERPADQLALSQRHHQLTRRQAAPTDLDRPRAALHRQLGVDQLRQPAAGGPARR